jgi:hypothetical protein
MATKPESFNTRAINVIGTPCWKLTVTNYGEKKSSFDFYTRSEKYTIVKKDIILKLSPDAIVKITPGVITFN